MQRWRHFREGPRKRSSTSKQALRIQPDYAEAHFNLGVALAQDPGKTREALAHLEAAERLQPDAELEKTIRQLRGR